ncbi:hypothetical protein MIND_01381100 [Mycena indigotica]|uniref:Conidiation-specific protein 6 n=1 Tax=Mycena indigotica TaxID=2126181 RepID=A0A8H6VPS6_9AGAR|nr:uncharacterized protein MIND_01381100 [Mycena indigotica]KAF7289199.1 hypothetical protein MIND_01381100 [Mycena indigotica]
MTGTDNTSKNPARVAAGLKSTLARDNVSDEAKVNAQERLMEMGYTEDVAAYQHDEELHQTRVQAGYKAALSNPKVSEEAKENARQHLEESELN